LLRLRGVQMGEIVGFISKSELERLRLIREARAIYDSIFPPTDDRAGKGDSPGAERPGHSKAAIRMAERS
jgi:hypothetical protein